MLETSAFIVAVFLKKDFLAKISFFFRFGYDEYVSDIWNGHRSHTHAYLFCML